MSLATARHGSRSRHDYPRQQGPVVTTGDVEYLQAPRPQSARGKDVINLYAEPPRPGRRPFRHQTLTSVGGSVGTAHDPRAQGAVVERGVDITNHDVRAAVPGVPQLQNPELGAPVPRPLWD